MRLIHRLFQLAKYNKAMCCNGLETGDRDSRVNFFKSSFFGFT